MMENNCALSSSSIWLLILILCCNTPSSEACNSQIPLNRKQRSLHSDPTSPFSKLGLTIQQQNSADDCLPSVTCNGFNKYRSIDGTCNNLLKPGWGGKNTALVRLLPPTYRDGSSLIRISQSGRWLPSPRILHTTLFPKTVVPDPTLTLAVMQWGQIIAHDVSFLRGKTGVSNCCTRQGTLLPLDQLNPGCLPIAVPTDDGFFAQFGRTCLEQKRAVTANDFNCNVLPVQQVSSVTHFLDGSNIYGSDAESASPLRTFQGGFLRGQFSPDRRLFLPNVAGSPSASCNNVRSEQEACYLAGDRRVNQNIEIAVSQVMFVRLHNWLVFNLARSNPVWNDEILYQEARRIVIAILQHITYNEYVPILLGRNFAKLKNLLPLRDGYSNGYDINVNPSTISEFAGAAFRSLHSTIQNMISLVNDNRTVVDRVRFSDWMQRPAVIQAPGNYDAFLRGFVTQSQQVRDIFFSEEVSNFLFKGKAPFGGDLLSLDINRGRDMGIPPYSQMRTLCGLPPVSRFEDLLDVMENEKIIRLSRVYDDVRDIDYLVGGMLEKRIPGTLTGPSFQCVLAEAFYRYKFGDRFYYEFADQAGSFTPDQLRVIRKVSFSMILCITSDNVRFVQANGFVQPNDRNPFIPCSTFISAFDFTPWIA